MDIGKTNFTLPEKRRKDLADLAEPVDLDWHHVAITYFEGTVRAYLDGERDGEADMTVYAAEGVDMWLGSCPNIGTAEHMFEGRVRNVQVFRNSLTHGQLKELARPEFITWLQKKWKLQTSIAPSKWCVNIGQLKDFVAQASKCQGLAANPCMYDVVDRLVKPRTRGSGLSWALQENPSGLPVKWFVSHAWKESIKDFAQALYDFKVIQPEDGIWVCFLANPQTWPRTKLAELLGTQAFHSPFATAMQSAKAQLVVRTEIYEEDRMACVYSRLWCVFELWMAGNMQADGNELKIIPLGRVYPQRAAEGMRKTIGVAYAGCSSDVDKERITLCVERGEDETRQKKGWLDRLTVEILTSQQGTELHA